MEEKVDASNLSVALLHYPVRDKNDRNVATAVTNLDVHDIARAAKTFGLHKYYVVTPLHDQRVLVSRIADHWQNGWGASYNPKRKEALDLVTIVDALDDAANDLSKDFAKPARVVATAARPSPRSTSFEEMRSLLRDETQPYLLVLGTGWGLTQKVIDEADYVLEPINGSGIYNHLSVRSAAAIMIDRLVGRCRQE